MLRGEPQNLPAGYAFGGWEGGDVSNVVQDMQIYGYTNAIRYHVTYHLNGGINNSTNPIVYYVTDGEIVLKDATKAGAIFKGWYASADYTTKVEKLSVEQLGDVELYALFEETGENSANGCKSVVAVEGGVVALLGMAMLLKKRKEEV